METMPLEKIIEIGVAVGVREALDRISRHKVEIKNLRHDRRLRNTELLLRNYKNFIVHYKNAIYSSKQLKDQNAIDILDECEDMDEELYIKSIQKSKERTNIIVNHIKAIIGYYKYKQSKEPNGLRKFQVIFGLYFEFKTYQTLSDELFCSTKTIERDRKEAIEELSVLIFGVDGLKLEV